MTQKEILQALKQMTNAECLIIAEAILRLIRENPTGISYPSPARAGTIATARAVRT
jgi:hypothetical protein